MNSVVKVASTTILDIGRGDELQDPLLNGMTLYGHYSCGNDMVPRIKVFEAAYYRDGADAYEMIKLFDEDQLPLKAPCTYFPMSSNLNI